MIGNNTTLGCIGFNSKDKKEREENAIEFGKLVKNAFDSGGSAMLIITD